MGYTPEHELEINNNLLAKFGEIKSIFDVGSRDDVEYLKICPDAEFHFFEPNPEFFVLLAAKLQDQVGKFHLNNFALSDVSGDMHYNPGLQSLRDQNASHPIVQVRTLDDYCKENNINSIDFLKVDVEGFDINVLRGGKEILPNIKFIEYEHWNNQPVFQELLGELFDLYYIGYRNTICVNKTLVPIEKSKQIEAYILENKFAELV